MERVSVFHEQLERAGIPIHGVSLEDRRVRLHFKPEATVEQQRQARTMAKAFDWAPRPPLLFDEVLGRVQALAAPDQARLLAAVLAGTLMTNPQLAMQAALPHLIGEE